MIYRTCSFPEDFLYCLSNPGLSRTAFASAVSLLH